MLEHPTGVDTSSLLKLVIDEDGSEGTGLIWDSADVLASVALVVVETILTSADTALGDAAQRRGLHVANPRSP